MSLAVLVKIFQECSRLLHTPVQNCSTFIHISVRPLHRSMLQVYRVKDNVTYSVVVEEYDAEREGWRPYTADDLQVCGFTSTPAIPPLCNPPKMLHGMMIRKINLQSNCPIDVVLSSKYLLKCLLSEIVPIILSKIKCLGRQVVLFEKLKNRNG